jgi:hypothetical protein
MLLGLMIMPRLLCRVPTVDVDIRLYPLIYRRLKKLLFRVLGYYRSLPTTHHIASCKNWTATRIRHYLLNLPSQVLKSSSKYFSRVILPTAGDIIGYDRIRSDTIGYVGQTRH